MRSPEHARFGCRALPMIYFKRQTVPLILDQLANCSSKSTDLARMRCNTEEPVVSANSPMPNEYCFIPKGNAYVTKLCRKLTHEAQKILYLVNGRSSQHLGIRCPVQIFDSVTAMENATRIRRARNVQKRDAAIASEFPRAMIKVFPRSPSTETAQIVNRFLKKHSGRVGRTGTLGIAKKVRLAVRAHIRHQHTVYDKLLRQGMAREDARKAVCSKIADIARSWGELFDRQMGS